MDEKLRDEFANKFQKAKSQYGIMKVDYKEQGLKNESLNNISEEESSPKIEEMPEPIENLKNLGK